LFKSRPNSFKKSWKASGKASKRVQPSPRERISDLSSSGFTEVSFFVTWIGSFLRGVEFEIRLIPGGFAYLLEKTQVTLFRALTPAYPVPFSHASRKTPCKGPSRDNDTGIHHHDPVRIGQNRVEVDLGCGCL
jgi:hypothetical protein